MWNNKRIEVFRADVMCTNGIIHVIDRPFIEESDIVVSYTAGASMNGFNMILLPNLLMLAIANLFF